MVIEITPQNFSVGALIEVLKKFDEKIPIQIWNHDTMSAYPVESVRCDDKQVIII